MKNIILLLCFLGFGLQMYAQHCFIQEIIAEPQHCENGQFFVEFDLIYQNTSDSFTVTANDSLLGSFAYDDLPLMLGPFDENDFQPPFQNLLNFIVQDSEDYHCAQDIGITEIPCSYEPQCGIFNLVTYPLPCHGNQFDVHLGFNHENVSDSFTVVGNGHTYGTFSYADLPIDLGPLEGDGETAYEFLVCDAQQPNCCELSSIDPVICDTSDCSIDALIAEAHPCENGQFYVDIDFSHENTSDSFTVTGNGIHYGTFSYSDLHITLGPFGGDDPDVLEFTVCDVGHQHCCEEVVIHAPDCDSSACELSNLCIRPNGCDGEEYYMEVDFDYQGVNDNGFDVFIDDEFFGYYSYHDLPLFLESPTVDDGQAHHLKICENDRPDCCVEGLFIAPECSHCAFSEFEYEIVECEEGQFYLSLDFVPFQVQGGDYIITGESEVFGLYEYHDLPQLIGPFVADGETTYRFNVYDALDPVCSKSIQLDPVDCEMVDVNRPDNSRRQDSVSWINYKNILEITPSFPLENALLSIHSTDGTLQFQRDVQGQPGQALQFNLNPLGSGYYFATLKTKKGILNYRFIFLD